MAEFRPVAEAFCLRQPDARMLQEAVAAADPGLPEEVSGLLVSALRISAKRIRDDPGLVPFIRRVAVGATALREGFGGRRG